MKRNMVKSLTVCVIVLVCGQGVILTSQFPTKKVLVANVGGPGSVSEQMLPILIQNLNNLIHASCPEVELIDETTARNSQEKIYALIIASNPTTSRVSDSRQTLIAKIEGIAKRLGIQQEIPIEKTSLLIFLYGSAQTGLVRATVGQPPCPYFVITFTQNGLSSNTDMSQIYLPQLAQWLCSVALPSTYHFTVPPAQEGVQVNPLEGLPPVDQLRMAMPLEELQIIESKLAPYRDLNRETRRYYAQLDNEIRSAEARQRKQLEAASTPSVPMASSYSQYAQPTTTFAPAALETVSIDPTKYTSERHVQELYRAQGDKGLIALWHALQPAVQKRERQGFYRMLQKFMTSKNVAEPTGSSPVPAPAPAPVYYTPATTYQQPAATVAQPYYQYNPTPAQRTTTSSFMSYPAVNQLGELPTDELYRIQREVNQQLGLRPDLYQYSHAISQEITRRSGQR